jgi:uridine kinase
MWGIAVVVVFAGPEQVHAGDADPVCFDQSAVEGDDFYRDIPEDERRELGPKEGYERYFDWERLLAEVVLPVSRGDLELRYCRYNWPNAKFGAWLEQPMPPIVLLEGVCTLRPQLQDLVDIKVYVATSEAVRLRRQIERNQDQDSDGWIKRWIAAVDPL